MYTFTWSEGSESVPVGVYQGVLTGIEPVAPNEEKGWGAGIRFSFEVTNGEHKGKFASRIVSIPKGKPSPKNGLGKILMGLNGGAPKVGEAIDPNLFIGKAYTVVVQQTAGGGTRVENVGASMA